MNSSTKDKIKGRIHEAKGKVKQRGGRESDWQSRSTGPRVRTEKVAGKVQNKVGDVKKVFGK